MVSSKDTNEGTGNMKDHCPYQLFHRRGAGGDINGFIEGHQGGREQGTTYAQLDMHGISPVIAAQMEWQLFISFPISLGKKLLDSGVCTLADSELIPLITQPATK